MTRHAPHEARLDGARADLRGGGAGGAVSIVRRPLLHHQGPPPARIASGSFLALRGRGGAGGLSHPPAARWQAAALHFCRFQGVPILAGVIAVALTLLAFLSRQPSCSMIGVTTGAVTAPAVEDNAGTAARPRALQCR